MTHSKWIPMVKFQFIHQTTICMCIYKYYCFLYTSSTITCANAYVKRSHGKNRLPIIAHLFSFTMPMISNAFSIVYGSAIMAIFQRNMILVSAIRYSHLNGIHFVDMAIEMLFKPNIICIFKTAFALHLCFAYHCIKICSLLYFLSTFWLYELETLLLVDKHKHALPVRPSLLHCASVHGCVPSTQSLILLA